MHENNPSIESQDTLLRLLRNRQSADGVRPVVMIPFVLPDDTAGFHGDNTNKNNLSDILIPSNMSPVAFVPGELCCLEKVFIKSDNKNLIEMSVEDAIMFFEKGHVGGAHNSSSMPKEYLKNKNEDDDPLRRVSERTIGKDPLTGFPEILFDQSSLLEMDENDSHHKLEDPLIKSHVINNMNDDELLYLLEEMENSEKEGTDLALSLAKVVQSLQPSSESNHLVSSENQASFLRNSCSTLAKDTNPSILSSSSSAAPPKKVTFQVDEKKENEKLSKLATLTSNHDELFKGLLNPKSSMFDNSDILLESEMSDLVNLLSKGVVPASWQQSPSLSQTSNQDFLVGNENGKPSSASAIAVHETVMERDPQTLSNANYEGVKSEKEPKRISKFRAKKIEEN